MRSRWRGRQLKLLDIYSSQMVRASKGEQAVVEVALSGDEYLRVGQNTGQDPVKENLELFEKEVTNVEDDYRM